MMTHDMKNEKKETEVLVLEDLSVVAGGDSDSCWKEVPFVDDPNLTQEELDRMMIEYAINISLGM